MNSWIEQIVGQDDSRLRLRKVFLNIPHRVWMATNGFMMAWGKVPDNCGAMPFTVPINFDQNEAEKLGRWSQKQTAVLASVLVDPKLVRMMLDGIEHGAIALDIINRDGQAMLAIAQHDRAAVLMPLHGDGLNFWRPYLPTPGPPAPREQSEAAGGEDDQ